MGKLPLGFWTVERCDEARYRLMAGASREVVAAKLGVTVKQLGYALGNHYILQPYPAYRSRRARRG
jgi:hypothetical protein